jgi:magnesium transporter
MLASVVAACLVGILIPFVLDKYGQDPAAASSPFVTAFADVVGVLIYFSVAEMII